MNLEKFRNDPTRIKTIVDQERFSKMQKVAGDMNIILDVVARAGEDYSYKDHAGSVPEDSVCVEIADTSPDIINDFWNAVDAE